MADTVTEFYDDFLEKTMVRYRIVGNARLDAAIELVAKYLRPGITVADIGCGIGIVSEALARKQRGADIIGLDLSPQNIRYAQATVDEPNARFIASSITEQFDALRRTAKRPVDLVCMIDVLEHIPEADRRQLFSDIADICSNEAIFVLTYPTPEFQRYRAEHDPEILQVIDNVVEFDDLYSEFRESGWHLARMDYRGIWVEDEYVYLVLRRKTPDEFPQRKEPFLASLRRRAGRLAIRPYLRWKYEKRPFRER